MMDRRRERVEDDRGEAGSARHPKSLEALQERIYYRFRNLDLLMEAITHSSFANEHSESGPDNQRLEFLGDAVLNFAVATWVFERYPRFKEGGMTRLRAALVCEDMLARFAAQLKLGEVLRLGRGEEENGGRERPANLADAFEALVGALCLDGGLGSVQQLLHGMLEPAASVVLTEETDKDPKSRLQEWSQAELEVTPSYCIVDEQGPDHAKVFTAEVLIGEQVVGRGAGLSKQAAEQAAAQEALSAGESILKRADISSVGRS